jgi:hypothetical protein
LLLCFPPRLSAQAEERKKKKKISHCSVSKTKKREKRKKKTRKTFETPHMTMTLYGPEGTQSHCRPAAEPKPQGNVDGEKLFEYTHTADLHGIKLRARVVRSSREKKTFS